VRRIGGTWGDLANMVFVAGSLIVLTMVIMSGAARRRLRVFLHKHFYRNKFDYRVEWLRFVSTLSASSEQDILRTCLQAMAQIFQSPGGVLFVRDAREPLYTAVASWPMTLRDSPGIRDIAAGDEMVRFLARKQWVIDLQEYSVAPELYQNIAVPEWLRGMRGVRLVSPVLQADTLEGFVLLYEPPPPFDLTYEDRDLLKTVGRHVALVLARNAAERRLTESRQFEAYHRLTAFMMHDLKNAIAQLDLVVANAAKHRHNPRFIDDALETVANAAARMTGLMAQLRRSDTPEQRHSLNVDDLLSEVIRRCADRRPVPLHEPGSGSAPVVRAERAKLLNVIEHVIRNAQDASQPESPLVVRRVAHPDHAIVEVQDHGSGMTPEFVRDRLFRPFDSTKGAKGMGIGAYQVLEYVRSLGGDVEVSSRPGAGTCFRIKLPAFMDGGR
jgi:putative PEP-CTERM system histidine kinase